MVSDSRAKVDSLEIRSINLVSASLPFLASLRKSVNLKDITSSDTPSCLVTESYLLGNKFYTLVHLSCSIRKRPRKRVRAFPDNVIRKTLERLVGGTSNAARRTKFIFLSSFHIFVEPTADSFFLSGTPF